MTPEEKKSTSNIESKKLSKPMKQQKYYLIMAFGIPL